MTTTEETNLAIIRAMYDSLLSGDISAVLANLHDDVEVEIHGPPAIPFAGRHRGRAEMERFFEIVAEHLHRDPTDPVPTVHEYIVQGDKVVAIGADRITSKATGSICESWWVHVLELREGKIARIREFIDTHAAVEAFRPTANA
jgi:ketosteroid isomerase-like protein